MRLSDLLEKKARGIFIDDEILKCELIALDAKTGKFLFNTSKNKREYINKYINCEVTSLWADCIHIEGVYGCYFKPVIKCYISNYTIK